MIVGGRVCIPKTNMAPENGWLQEDPFPFRRPIFQGRVSSREGIKFSKKKQKDWLKEKTSGECSVTK